MQETRTLCDRCGKAGASDVSLAVGRKMDVAGSTGDVILAADLCDNCKSSLFLSLLGQISEGRVTGHDTLVKFLENLISLSNSNLKGEKFFSRYDP